jgi:thioredoxin-related protein
MKIVKRFSVLLILFILLASFKPKKKSKIKWISITELNEQYKIQPKPILIDVYTNWCGWCRVMEKETYSQESVSSYINDNYYAVKFDAETTDSVEFNGRKFGYNTSYKANELAIYLLDGRMGYPTTILLSSINAQPAPLSGFLKPSELEPPLKFFAEGAYKKKEFPEYMKDFTAKW